MRRIIARVKKNETQKVKDLREVSSERLEILSTKRRDAERFVSTIPPKFLFRATERARRWESLKFSGAGWGTVNLTGTTRILLGEECKHQAGGAKAACSPGCSSNSCSCPSHFGCAVGRQSQ